MKPINWIALLLVMAAITGFVIVRLDPDHLIAIVNSSNLWLVIAGYLFNLWVADRLIATWTRQWDAGAHPEGMPKAGQAIGRLERLLVYTFVLLNQFAAIGFLITAKSIFRFPEISSSLDRQRVEYILIGTLLSFAIAIFSGLLIRSLTFGI